MTRRTVTLPAQVHRVLKNLNMGGGLRRQRVFPFPHEYILRKVDGTGDYAGRIAIDTVALLLEHRLVDALQHDKLGDSVTYVLTDAGRQVAETKALVYEDENREMFAP